MATYYAVLFSDDDGGFYAEFPDLPGCFTQADSLEVADAMLKDALNVWLDASKEDGDVIPKSRSFDAIYAEVSGRTEFHSVTLVAVPDPVKRVRKNVSFTESDLAIIDSAAAQFGMDRSEFLAMAAKQVAAGNCNM